VASFQKGKQLWAAVLSYKQTKNQSANGMISTLQATEPPSVILLFLFAGVQFYILASCQQR